MTSTHTPHKRPPTPSGRHPGTSVPDVAAELRRLMPRDRWLLDLLHQHQVFTTEQIAALGFDHVHTTRNRLNLLLGRQVLARFRDAVRHGSQSWRWTPGWIGAAFIAYRDSQPVPRPATIADRVNTLSTDADSREHSQSARTAVNNSASTRTSSRHTVVSTGTQPVNPSRPHAGASRSSTQSPTAANVPAPAITAHTATASTLAKEYRIPRGSRGSGTRARTSNRP